MKQLIFTAVLLCSVALPVQAETERQFVYPRWPGKGPVPVDVVRRPEDIRRDARFRLADDAFKPCVQGVLTKKRVPKQLFSKWPTAITFETEYICENAKDS